MITMKYIQSTQALGLVLSAFLFVGTLTSCNEQIEVAQLDESKYAITNDIIGYITNHEGKRSISNVELRKNGSVDLSLNSTQKVAQDCSVTLTYDPSILEAYNTKQETSYEILPEKLITIAENGAMNIPSGNNKSAAIKLSFTTDQSLSAGGTYVIPLKVSTQSEGLKLSPAESTYLIFVKDYTKVPNCDKASGIKIISCMEINDTNPLSNLCFTLKKTGQPLIDIVVLFSSNINYSAEKGRVYVNHNKNIQHILNNRDKYIKPLQDRGMKVILAISGHGDHAGLMSLDDQTAINFAKELKITCDAYKLDGVFFDDEYSKYITTGTIPKGFVYPSRNAASRLCYETKKAMPDKLLCIYAYGGVERLSSVDGKQPGEYIDYGIRDYEIGEGLGSNYPGLSKSGMAIYSQEFRRNKFATNQELQSMRSDGYGAHMIFALNPFVSLRQVQLENLAKILFDDELVYDEKPYKKDW